MYEALAILVIGLTVVSFWLKNGLLLLCSGLAWVIWGAVMVNVGTGAGEPFAGNAFLPQAFFMLGGAIAIVCFVSAYIVWASRRPGKRTYDEQQENYKQRILKITKRRPRY